MNIPPQLYNGRITLSPGIHNRLQFFLSKPHINSTHADHRSNATTISKCQFCDLTFLTQLSIDTMLFNRNTKHLTGRCAIDITVVPKNFLTPALPSKPCNYPGLNCTKVSYHKLTAFSRHKCSTNKLGKGIWNRIVQKLYCFKATTLYQVSCYRQIRNMVLWEVLHLHKSACPAASSVGSIKLQQSMCPSIAAAAGLHCHIFFHAGLGKKLPKL